MPDREKVIKGLEKAKMVIEQWIPMFEQYNTPAVIDDAVALLKEQEVVELKQVGLYGKDDWWGLVCVCPDCNAEWMTDKADTHFCPNCGRPVKWE